MSEFMLLTAAVAVVAPARAALERAMAGVQISDCACGCLVAMEKASTSAGHRSNVAALYRRGTPSRSCARVCAP
jgi:hypothetical protein